MLKRCTLDRFVLDEKTISHTPSTRLRISGLPEQTSEKKLKIFLAREGRGTVRQLDFNEDKTFADVEFESAECKLQFVF